MAKLDVVLAKMRVTKVVTSYSNGTDFVSMTVEPPEGESFSLEEAQLAEKLLSKEVTAAVHKDALARGTISREKVATLNKKVAANFDKLIELHTTES